MEQWTTKDKLNQQLRNQYYSFGDKMNNQMQREGRVEWNTYRPMPVRSVEKFQTIAWQTCTYLERKH